MKTIKTIHFFDLTGVHAGSFELPEGEEMPLDATEVAPPEDLAEGLFCRWNGADWTIESGRRFTQY